MARIQILSKSEEKSFDTAPKFSSKEQTYFFKITEDLLDKFLEFKGENITFILIQYGYFRARHKFFEQIHPNDIEYIKEKFSFEEININIPKSTRFRYYSVIKEVLSIELFDVRIKALLEKEALDMAKNFQDRKKIFFTLVDLSKKLKIEIPSLAILTDIIAQALGEQKKSIINKLKNYEKDEKLIELNIFITKNQNFKNKYSISSFKKLEHWFTINK